MNKQNEEYDDEINLYNLWIAIAKRKMFIIFFTLACAVAAVLISLLMPKVYESEGMFLYGESVLDYRAVQTRLLDAEIFYNLLTVEPSIPEGNKKKIEKQKSTGVLTKLLSKRIDPLYASSQKDAKLLGGSLLKKDEENSVIGFLLSWQDSSPENAQRMVFFLARHIKNQTIYNSIYKQVTFANSNFIKALADLDNKKIQSESKLEQLQKKLKEIQLLMKRYPGADASNSRQIVSTQEGGQRYLPPANQAIGIESAIADIKEQLLIIERDRKISSFGFEFYNALAAELEKIPNGEILMARHDEWVKKFAQSHDLTDDTAREFHNTVVIRNEEFKKTFNHKYRFISGPTLPSYHIKPRRSVIILVVTFLSFFIALFIALIVDWWTNQRKVVTSD